MIAVHRKRYRLWYLDREALIAEEKYFLSRNFEANNASDIVNFEKVNISIYAKYKIGAGTEENNPKT